MSKNSVSLMLSCLGFSFVLFACVPDLHNNKNTNQEIMDPPQNFPNQALTNQDSSTVKIEKPDLVRQNWKLFFKDAELIALIEIALQNNQDLNILEQKIAIASNEVMARQGNYLPKIGAQGGYELDKSSKYTSKGASDDLAKLPSRLGNRQLSVNATWEVDIWKKLRNYAKSAYYEYLATIEGKNFAITQLASEVANDYYDLMALDNELEIIGQYVKTLEDAQKVVQLQQIAGRTTSLAVRRFDAELLKIKARKYKIQQQIIVTENHLNFLLGRLPQNIKRQSSEFKSVEMSEVATNLPIDLLDNRPDVKEASLNLEASKLNVNAVKAQFYPSLNIDASLGYKSFNSQHFANSPQSLFYSIAGAISVPLLNRNAIKADYFSANNKQIEAIYEYEKEFLKAYLEVENQISLVQNLREIYGLKKNQVDALEASFEISNMLFKSARINYLELLLTRRDYLESQLELIEVKQDQIVGYINLYKALGGGWRN